MNKEQWTTEDCKTDRIGDCHHAYPSMSPCLRPCFSRHRWRCYHALGGVLQSKTPQFKIGTEADFEPACNCPYI